MGMTIVIAMRGLDLSVGSVMGFSSIVAALLLNNGTPIPLTVLATLAVGLALGLGNGLLIALLRLPSFVATLATLSMILGIELMITQGRTVPIHSSTLNTLVVGNIGVIPAAAVVAVVVFGVMWIAFYHLPFGRHLAAIGGDARAALSAGINLNRVTLGVFMLVGMCAALAGLMTAAQLQNADSTIGFGAELTAIATVVVGGTSLAGGRGNLFGTCCAALLLAAIKTGLNVVNVSPRDPWQGDDRCLSDTQHDGRGGDGRKRRARRSRARKTASRALQHSPAADRRLADDGGDRALSRVCGPSFL
jgi:ribose/xylose/arabinose/galactoside ABC-type transport system permease subunit